MTGRPKGGFRTFLRVLALLGCVLLLAASAGGAYIWLLHGQASMESYRPPLRVQPEPGGQVTAPLAPQVVLVVIDGLRVDAVADMPTLALLQRQGAAARALVRPPSYSQPCWTTLVTGAWPELNGSALLNAPDDAIQPIPADHIFAAAKRAGLTTALAGASWWASMIPPETLDAHFYVDSFQTDGDQQTADAGLRFLNNFSPNLALIYFGNVDTVGEAEGARSAAYLQAAAQVDDHLRDIVAALDPGRAVLIVTSDHGQVDRGGHGGGEPEVVYTPFVAVGDAIVPGEYGTIAQADIAPTIAAILGAPVPRSSQGTVRFEMLHTDALKRAQVQLDLAQQRRDLGNLYLNGINQGSLSETAEGDVAVAESSMEVENLDSAYGLARIAADRIDQEMASARQHRIQVERGLRLPVLIVVVGLPLLLLVVRGGRRGGWLLLAALATQLAYHALFLYQSGVYSFSSVEGLDPFVNQTALRVVVASVVGASIVLWRLVREHEDSVLGVIQTSLGYSLLTVWLLGCQAAVAYWLDGFRFSWYVPDMAATFWQLSALVQAIVTAAVGLALPVVLILAGLAYQGARALRRRQAARRPRPI